MGLNELLGLSLSTGKTAPEFKLQDQSGQWHDLKTYRGKWVVLYFYPRDNTPGCTLEACSFRDRHENFVAADTVVLGVSTDSVDSHQKFSESHQLPFPILADVQKTVAKAYGVLLPFGVANRVTFIIDPQGIVRDRLSWVNWSNYADTVEARLERLRGAK